MIINSQTFILEDKEEVIISDGYGIIPVHDMERYLGQGSMNRPPDFEPDGHLKTQQKQIIMIASTYHCVSLW